MTSLCGIIKFVVCGFPTTQLFCLQVERHSYLFCTTMKLQRKVESTHECCCTSLQQRAIAEALTKPTKQYYIWCATLSQQWCCLDIIKIWTLVFGLILKLDVHIFLFLFFSPDPTRNIGCIEKLVISSVWNENTPCSWHHPPQKKKCCPCGRFHHLVGAATHISPERN